MKLSGVSTLLCALSLVDGITAHPEMSKTLREIEEVAKTKRAESFLDWKDLDELFEDYEDFASGWSIANILLRREPAQKRTDEWSPPGPPGSPKCKADTCCIWAHVSKTLTELFVDGNGQCNDNARSAVRFGFHDAGAWRKGLDFGGADGSLVLSDVEINRRENSGLAGWRNKVKELVKKFDVGVADFVQFAATHAAVSCPLGPHMRVFVGRPDSSRTAPENLIPSPFGTADELIQLFQDKSISPHDLVALLGAHSTSKQRFVDPQRAGAPQDTTPGIWDVLYYKETLQQNPPAQIFRFQSDINLSKDRRTAEEFRDFAGRGGQEHWNEDYAKAYLRLSLLGVRKTRDLTECTKALPQSGDD
ncbi:unnamed protein product [Periconia digitata]|uniref:Peroxidase n=1 Tax=Periconia digitata TaxID=1303443 RepID=A0A9W4XTH5_9PLEO|nr:unnamed protein product [Periconia digitata]